MRLFLPIAPPSANRIWRTGRGVTFLSADALAYYKEAKAWTERVDPDIKAVDVRIWIVPIRRGIDCDNRIKPVLDAITKAGVWKDDSIVASVAIKLITPDKKKFPKGATFVEITPVAEKYGKEEDVWTK
ncbi:MAG: RusA family crossover junction endodeoxyribonuclease [Thermoguttaceae bacterium]|nr:RusA family crossover junction endodeoxyribonuclease [Thermoguttaceae bacterium]